METQALADTYAAMTDASLLQLASQTDQLTEEAKYYLDAELRRRSLGTAELDAYRADSAKGVEEDKRDAQRRTFNASGLLEYPVVLLLLFIVLKIPGAGHLVFRSSPLIGFAVLIGLWIVVRQARKYFFG